MATPQSHDAKRPTHSRSRSDHWPLLSLPDCSCSVEIDSNGSKPTPKRASDDLAQTRTRTEGDSIQLEPREVARTFLEAATPDEQLRWVRDGTAEHIKSGLVKSFKRRSELEFLRPIARQRSQDLYYTSFHARFSDGESRLVCVVEDTSRNLVDWEAYARYCSTPWESLLSGAAQQAEVRVFLAGYRVEGGNGTPAARVSFTLNSPDLERDIFGYVPLGSRSLAVIGDILKSKSRRKSNVVTNNRRRYLPPRVTLRLSAENDSYKERTFRIDRIVADGWVKSNWGDLEDTWVPSEDTIDDMADRWLQQRNRAKDQQTIMIPPER